MSMLEGKQVRFLGDDTKQKKIAYGAIGTIEHDKGKYLLIRFGKNLFSFFSLNGLELI